MKNSKTVEENLIDDIADRLLKHIDIIGESSKIGEKNPV